ncbi:MAG: cellulase family glycosylhydrolase [Verrucomicrobiales bacterium]|nr:cellulase family glycosylhydrolase [Verrucomicrobiales bacterium]
MNAIPRRTFLQNAAVATAGSVIAPTFWTPGAATPSEPSAAKLPRWRGFNLLEKFIQRREGNPPFRETDFQMMQDWGFDFARLPMSYQCWSWPDPAQWLEMDEAQIQHLDQAVKLGRRHGIHINLNLHRAPGYCVNPPKEPLDLWKDAAALDASAHHWATLAKRFKGVSNRELSFDLLNEPADIPAETYARVVRHLVAAIRAEDSQRLIIADGLKWGRDPVEELIGLGVAQSTRGYDPMRVSHHQANWIHGSEKWESPSWPLQEGDGEWNRDRLRRERIAPWQALAKRGVGVHVGEWGAHNRTPHAVVLAWMRDQLALWQEAGWGWALWNLRGSFGVLDSGRSDVVCEDFHGHKLDRAMLKLLQAG